jgi:hypothetical protein
MNRLGLVPVGFLLGAVATSANASYITDVTTFHSWGISSDLATPSVLDGYGYGAVNRPDGTFDYVTWTHRFELEPGARESRGPRCRSR